MKFHFISCLSWKNTAMQTDQCRQNLQEILSALYFSSTSSLIKVPGLHFWVCLCLCSMLISRPRLWHSHETQGQTRCYLHTIHILPTLKYKQSGNSSNKFSLQQSGLLIFDKLYLLFSTSGFSLLFFMRIFLLRSLGDGKALPCSSCKTIQRKRLIIIITTATWPLCILVWNLDFRTAILRGSEEAVPPQAQPQTVV